MHGIVVPAQVRDQVQLANSASAYLMMRARKVADVEMFRTTPQQSDYHDKAWAKERPDQSSQRLGWKQRLARHLLPRPLRRGARRLSHAVRRTYASPHFTKVTIGERLKR